MNSFHLVLGLGNPGPDYADTRHNAGFWLADALVERLGLAFRQPFLCPWYEARCPLQDLVPLAWPGTDRPALDVSPGDMVVIVKPLTFMNRSGDVIPTLDRRLAKISCERAKTLVLVDQMDLPPGEIRLKSRGGTAGHNGLKSIFSYLSEAYLPLYIGIGRPSGGESVIDHVLGVPSNEHRDHINGAWSRSVEAIALTLLGFTDQAMSIANARQSKSDS